VSAAPPEQAPPPTATPVPTPTPALAATNTTEPAPAAKPVAPAKPPEPARRPRFDVAVLQVLDKVTAQTLRFEAAVGKPVRYKSLIFTVRACERSAPDEPGDDSIAYVEIMSQPRAEPGRPVLAAKQAFRGWMFASSPSLDPLEHGLYDAWLINCRAAAPSTGGPGL